MDPPKQPEDEAARLAALRDLGILDTPAEERFDRVIRLASRLFDVPIAIASFVDEHRQWFKSKQGLEATETSRDVSFCGHTILGGGVFVVPDAREDPRFTDNPLVSGDPNIRFYAGCPLELAGHRVGTICLIDRVPRSFSTRDEEALRDLAILVERELQATRAATTDELTGLTNRRGFLALSERSMAVARRHRLHQSLLYLDLDHFRVINERWGHEEGDRALVEMSRIMLETFRESDVVARLGGDEFGVLLTGVEAESLPQVLARLRCSVAAANVRPGRTYALSYSVGAVSFDGAAPSALSRIMAQADRSMVEQKRRKSTSGTPPRDQPP